MLIRSRVLLLPVVEEDVPYDPAEDCGRGNRDKPRDTGAGGSVVGLITGCTLLSFWEGWTVCALLEVVTYLVRSHLHSVRL